MRIVTPAQMREIDNRCISEYNIPGIVLMENAASSLFQHVLNKYNINPDGADKTNIAIICGKGNNGGDGLACARKFINLKCDTKIFLCSDEDELSGDARTNYLILKAMDTRMQVLDFSNIEYFKEQLRNSDVIIDCILGTGLSSEITGLYKKIIDTINQVRADKDLFVVSADIPSGISAASGCVLGTAVKADLTVTFGLPKIGNMIYPGKDYCGELEICDIGIPDKLLNEIRIKTYGTESKLVKNFFPKRISDTNKGNYGKIGIISGCSGMTGAGIMAARAALRSGAGLVYIITPENLAAIYETASLETVTAPIIGEDNFFTLYSLDAVLDICAKLDSIIIGPGLGRDAQTKEFVIEFLRAVDSLPNSHKRTIIVDADALNLISSEQDLLLSIRTNIIITPHPGEMSSLASLSIKDIQSARITTAANFAAENEVTVVLKGAATIIAMPDGTIYINPNGNPGMATAGSGDVLTGIIASLSVNEIESELAAPCGVYIHGLAGDLASGKLGEYSMTAGDIVNNIPNAIKQIQNR